MFKLHDIKQFLLTIIQVPLNEEKKTSRNRKLHKLPKNIERVHNKRFNINSNAKKDRPNAESSHTRNMGIGKYLKGYLS
jgi:hypothetical protein